jgi:dienelactone hydrolase
MTVRMWIERTMYFAKPGCHDRVLATRRRASACRVAIGLDPGRIFVRRDGDGPDVSWECGFESAEAHEADLAARGASPEFGSIRAQMGELIARFERHVAQVDDFSPLQNGIGPSSLVGRAIIPQEIPMRSGPYSLKAYLLLPPGDGPHPCMLLNHGSGIDQGTQDVCRPGTAALLAGWGIASCLLHRHGYGNSEGPGWREDVSAAPGTAEYATQLTARLDREAQDVLAGLAMLAARPDIRAEHIGVMGSSFGGVNTLLAATRTDGFRCAVEFAGAAMNWDRAPALREALMEAAAKVRCPIFFIQAANDYSIGPTESLPGAVRGAIVQAMIYPPFGVTAHEGHLFERDGSRLWGDDVRRFLERYL